MANFMDRCENWFSVKNNLEIYYPHKFTPIYPWNPPKKPPTFPWTVEDFTDPRFTENMKYEVKRNDVMSLFDSAANNFETKTVSVPLTHLVHGTHTEPAEKITRENDYCFKPQQKKGKDGSFRFCLEEEPEYLEDSQILPGSLSWWGISTKEWYKENDAGKEKAKIENNLRIRENGERVYCSLYLQAKDPPGSHYGEWSFTCEFDKLLDSYKASRPNDAVDIYFRKAGTLRYRHEVCYVIIICTGKDLDQDEIEKMPPANALAAGDESPIFEDRGFLDNKGKVVRKVREDHTNWEGVPHFISEYPIMGVYKSGRSRYTWDHLTFAFYFPDHSITLRKEDVIKDEAEHARPYCHKGCP